MLSERSSPFPSRPWVLSSEQVDSHVVDPVQPIVVLDPETSTTTDHSSLTARPGPEPEHSDARGTTSTNDDGTEENK